MHMMVLGVSLAFMALIAVTFILVARARPPRSDANRSEARRRQLIWAMVIFGVVVSVASLARWPHAVSAAPTEVVNVTGTQWYWEIDRTEVPQGVPVLFSAKTTDVTHGFGVVDEKGRILFQAQVIPGYENKVEYNFDEPGIYKVICLEFCGVAHHEMVNEFIVAAR
ncbi:cupredoxin domain-containing protein [Afifella pfennigii]|uniref:cytochrome c oxidase subunit I n=1 Tax=Afifella pfennigii TaxID=209897 RepID=UPI000478ACCE|nr:cytochrome c oxidase subunit I [Afifella pfennigii]